MYLVYCWSYLGIHISSEKALWSLWLYIRWPPSRFKLSLRNNIKINCLSFVWYFGIFHLTWNYWWSFLVKLSPRFLGAVSYYCNSTHRKVSVRLAFFDYSLRFIRSVTCLSLWTIRFRFRNIQKVLIFLWCWWLKIS